MAFFVLGITLVLLSGRTAADEGEDRVLEGRVVASDGSALTGVAVRAVAYRGLSKAWEAETSTGADGVFRFLGVPPSVKSASVYLEGLPSSLRLSEPFSMRVGGGAVALRIQPGHTIEGELVGLQALGDAAALPRSFPIVAVWEPTGIDDPGLLRVRARPGRRFKLRSVPVDAQVAVSVDQADLREYGLVGSVVFHRGETVRVSIARAEPLRGRLDEAAARHAGGASVRVSPAESLSPMDALYHQSVVVSSDGTFTFPTTMAGAQRILAFATDCPFADSRFGPIVRGLVNVTAPSSAVVEVPALKNTRPMRIRVKGEGDGEVEVAVFLGGVRVAGARAALGELRSGISVTVPEGVGVMGVVAQAKDGRISHAPLTTEATKLSLSLQPPREVRGRVVGDLPAGARVAARIGGHRWMGVLYGREFTVSGLPHGDLVVELWGRGGRGLSHGDVRDLLVSRLVASETVPAGETPRIVEIRATPK